MLYAGIDLGTYLCRVILAEPKSNTKLGFKILLDYTYIVNFGNVFPGFALDEAIIQKLEKIFLEIKKLLKEADEVRCVATAALRFCNNSEKIIKRIKEKSGIDIEIITPEEEAELSSFGSKDLIQKEAMIVDIGSGSIEIGAIEKISNNLKLKECVSLNLGLLNNIGNNNTNNQEIQNLELAKINMLFSKYKKLPVICSRCSTLKIIYSDINKVFTNFHGKKIKMDDFENSMKKFSEMSVKNLKKLPSVGFKRLKLIQVGLPWIFKVFKTMQIDEIILSEHGIKEGLIMSMINEKT